MTPLPPPAGPPPAPGTPSPADEPEGARSARTLAAGQVLAGRFRVVRFIAQGGMGEVWEAEDLEFSGEPVALKTIRPEIAGNGWAMARFRREISLGKQVTHPNVCRIFDLFQHRPDAASGGVGPSADVTFLTMELLAGQTLAERLRAGGGLPAEEALPIALQVVAGLESAHAAGVAHGDLKSANIMLGAGRDGRAVITDFGLAHGGAEVGASAPGSTAGELFGTPGYMAPEQMQGAPPSVAVDIYALGVVLHEMVTGRLPPGGAQAVAPASRRAGVGRPAEWESILRRCLAADPRDRFTAVREVGAALAGAAPRARRQWRRWAAGALLGLVAAAVCAALLWRARSAPGAAPPSVAARRGIAVLGFKNLSARADSDWLAVALPEMLATELGAGGELRVLPTETVSRGLGDLEIRDFETLAPDTLRRVRRTLGADLVVLGSFVALGPESGGGLRLDLKLQDAASGEIVQTASRSGSEAQLFELVAAVGGELRKSLAGGGPAGSPAALVAVFPTDREAARLYSEGLAKLRLSDAVAAQRLLAQAIEIMPEQPMLHSALSAAWAALGYDARARAEAQRALDLSAALPREQRLAIEARLREAGGEWSQAAEIYRALVRFFPDNADYGLRLATAETATGDARTALATIAALRQLPPPLGQDLRIDLAEAEASEALSDFRGALGSAERGAAAAREVGARLLVARAQIIECQAARSLGEPDRAQSACASARDLFAGAGDRGGAASATNTLGIVAWQRGDLVTAKRFYEEALGAFRAIGDRRGEARALNNLAIVLYQQGDLAGARAMYDQVLATYREVDNRRGLASTLSNVGALREAQGDLGGARQTHDEALALRRAIGDRKGEAESLNNLAHVTARQGDPSAARSAYGEALTVFRAIADRSGAADALFNLAALDRQGADLDTAEARLREALRLKREIEDQAGEANALTALGDLESARGLREAARADFSAARTLRVALADDASVAGLAARLALLTLAAGDTPRALTEARSAVAATQAAENGDEECDARQALARVLVATGDLAGARREAAAASRLAGDAPALGTMLAIGTLTARLAGLSGDAAAGGKLRAVEREAAAAGRVEAELEARLARAEVERARGARSSAESIAREVETRARARGLGELASEAERLRTAPTGGAPKRSGL